MTAKRSVVSTGSHLARLLRIAFVVATFAAGALFLLKEQDALINAFNRMNYPIMLIALVFSVSNALLAYLSWFSLLKGHADNLKISHSFYIYFVSQLGKYLPGGIWPFVAVAELGKQAGIERRTMLGFFTTALIIGVGTGILTSVIALPDAIDLNTFNPRWLWFATLLVPVLIFPSFRSLFARIWREKGEFRASDLLRSVSFAIVAWVFAGAQLLTISYGLNGQIGTLGLLYFTGVYAASWIIGFLFMIAPAGFGPREATMIALLTPTMSLVDATMTAILSRIAVTIADFLLGAVATFVQRERVFR